MAKSLKKPLHEVVIFLTCTLIHQKQTDLTIEKLIGLARIKFDFHIDFLQLGANITKVVDLKDDPILKTKIDYKVIQNFFLSEAAKLKRKIIVLE